MKILNIHLQIIANFQFQTLLYNTVVQKRLSLATFTIFYLNCQNANSLQTNFYTVGKKTLILTINYISTICDNVSYFVHESPHEHLHTCTCTQQTCYAGCCKITLQ